MVRYMKLARLLFAALLMLSAIHAFSQGTYLEKGTNGFGGEARLIWTAEGFQGVGIGSGYSIAGILDIGASLVYTLGELGGFDASDLRVAFDYRVNVLKQAPGVPLSLQIIGSYGLNDAASEYLDNDNAVRRGTGYSIGLNLIRDLRIIDFLALRLNLLVDYESITYSTFGDTLDSTEHAGTLLYGGGAGMLFILPKGQTIALRAELRADENLDLQVVPVLGVAFPHR